MTSTTLGRMIQSFWAAYFTLVLASNLTDAAKALGWLGEDWAFASGNFPLLVKTTAVYDTPVWLVGLLFAGVIAWEALAAVLYWRAAIDVESVKKGDLACTVGAGLFAAFVLADELLIAYRMEGVHLRLFTSQVVSLVAVRVLRPNR